MASTQKGFLSNVSGCLEHHEIVDQMLNHLADQPNSTQIIGILTDISNAFGSIKKGLIKFALEYYSFPTWFVKKIMNIYSKLKLKITDLKNKSETIEPNENSDLTDVISVGEIDKNYVSIDSLEQTFQDLHDFSQPAQVSKEESNRLLQIFFDHYSLKLWVRR